MTTYARFGTYNAVLPKAGPKAYPFQLDFRTVNKVDIDMTPEITQGFIDFCSGVIFDNRLNANPLEILVAGCLQSVGIPAGKQGQMPLLIGDAAQLTFTTPINNQLIVPIFVVNFPVYPIVF